VQKGKNKGLSEKGEKSKRGVPKKIVRSTAARGGGGKKGAVHLQPTLKKP